MLNEGKTEKAGLPPLIGFVPGLRVGGPSKGVAMPWATSEFPWGILAMRVTSSPPSGGDSNGSEVGGWFTSESSPLLNRDPPDLTICGRLAFRAQPAFLYVIWLTHSVFEMRCPGKLTRSG